VSYSLCESCGDESKETLMGGGGCILTLDLLEKFSCVKKDAKVTDFWNVDVLWYDANVTPCISRNFFHSLRLLSRVLHAPPISFLM